MGKKIRVYADVLKTKLILNGLMCSRKQRDDGVIKAGAAIRIFTKEKN